MPYCLVVSLLLCLALCTEMSMQMVITAEEPDLSARSIGTNGCSDLLVSQTTGAMNERMAPSCGLLCLARISVVVLKRKPSLA